MYIFIIYLGYIFIFKDIYFSLLLGVYAWVCLWLYTCDCGAYRKHRCQVTWNYSCRCLRDAQYVCSELKLEEFPVFPNFELLSLLSSHLGDCLVTSICLLDTGLSCLFESQLNVYPKWISWSGLWAFALTDYWWDRAQLAVWTHPQEGEHELKTQANLNMSW